MKMCLDVQNMMGTPYIKICSVKQSLFNTDFVFSLVVGLVQLVSSSVALSAKLVFLPYEKVHHKRGGEL